MSAEVVGATGGAAPPPVTESPPVRPAAVVRQVEPIPAAVAEGREQVLDKVKRATVELNRVLSSFDKRIKFHLDEATEQVVVEIINRETEEVVRTIPPEEMLELMARLHEAVGMILDIEG